MRRRAFDSNNDEIAEGDERPMPQKKNALEELADWLDWTITIGRLSIEVPTNVQCDRHYLLEAFKKAQRIVAELAKVKTLGPNHVTGDISLYGAYANCRAIAEGGAEK